MTTTFALGGDLQVDRLGFGTIRLVMSGFDGPSRDRETGLAVLRRAVELGVNHIDTAEFYRGRDGGRASTSSSGRRCTPTRTTW